MGQIWPAGHGLWTPNIHQNMFDTFQKVAEVP